MEGEDTTERQATSKKKGEYEMKIERKCRCLTFPFVGRGGTTRSTEQKVAIFST